jgi:ubiquinone/menaquinone biosynthesis C-methylase UbiE
MPGSNIKADICDATLESNSFDYVLAISVLEHIYTPHKALANMVRIGKQVLLTLPFGYHHTMPWGTNYGADEIKLLTAPYQVQEEEYFGYFDGWTNAVPEQLAGRAYYSGGASDAAGVVCLRLKAS